MSKYDAIYLQYDFWIFFSCLLCGISLADTIAASVRESIPA